MKLYTFECSSCLKPYLKWSGQCNGCGEWSTITESKQTTRSSQSRKNFSPPVKLCDIVSENKTLRLKTGIDEFDRVLGGGIVSNSALLLAGMPGVGKSTLLLMIAEALSRNYTVLYVSSEESIEQVKGRANRLNIRNSDSFLITHETDIESIMGVIESCSPDLVILDSLQNASIQNQFLSMHINTIKHVAHMLVEHTRKFNYTFLSTCHVTKDGEIAGPKALEHIVDVILYFENTTEGTMRILRSNKNRFGRTDEAGFFIMEHEGIVPCSDPQNFLVEHKDPTIGSSFSWYQEGSRLFLVEIQTLINQSRNNNPQRVIHGIDQKQLILVCAVLEKYLKIPLYEYDIFCKVSGSIKLRDSHTDLALASALLSSYMNTPFSNKIVFSGEIGLSGDINSTSSPSSYEVFKRYGVDSLWCGKNSKEIEGITIHNIPSIYGLMKLFKKNNN